MQWKSYNDTLKGVHLPSALNSTFLDFEVEASCIQTPVDVKATFLSGSRIKLPFWH